MTEPTAAITSRITDEVRARGASVTAVAEQIGMSSSTWHRRMRRPETWTIAELDALALVLRVERSRLTG